MSEPLRITIKPSGSILIEADVVVVDSEGRVLPPPAQKRPGSVKLCGCGRSAHRPFCDGSHNQVAVAQADGA